MSYNIGILNVGVNNLKSVISFFNKFGKIIIINENNLKEDLKNIDLLIIPGNGSFSVGSEYLTKNNIVDDIKNFKKKIFGICLGMQLLFETSEESPNSKGLSLLKGNVKKIISKKIKLPLLGWYSSIDKKKNINNFFFNNNFSCNPLNRSIISQVINTNDEEIVAVVNYKNIYGMQFHPEKSSTNGYKFIKKIINE